MAMTRRSFLSLTRHVTTFLSPKTLFPISQKIHFQNPNLIPIWQTPTSQFCSKLSDNSESKEENENEENGISKIPIWPISQKTRFQNPNLLNSNWQKYTRQFCSKLSDESESEEENENEEEGIEYESDSVTNLGGLGKKVYTTEEREEGAKEIGYRVLGPLERSDRVFKDYEPVFAVIQIGSHQFKVSNGDCIYTERLKFCEVNDKLVLNKVLMLGSSAQTIIGRPILPDAAVHAVVEEHALDAKVIIFKKKRRKNYRRTKGHRQELTKLRITDIQGIEKPDITASGESEKVVAVKKKSKKVDIPADKKPEKVAVPA